MNNEATTKTTNVQPGRQCVGCHRVIRSGQSVTEIRPHTDSPLRGLLHAECATTVRPECIVAEGLIAVRVPEVRESSRRRRPARRAAVAAC